MDEYTEKNLNDFFQKEYIDSKTVLIFDHVIDLGIILTKQKLYHFQLVFILYLLKPLAKSSRYL